MQITRGWPRSFEDFSRPLRLALPALALGSCLTGGANAAIPAPMKPSVNPENSLTGWLMAATVMMERGDVPAANLALSHALPLAPHNLQLQQDALRYAAMGGHQAEAIKLANSLPDRDSGSDVGTLILAQDAFARRDWAGLRLILTRNPHHGPLVAIAAPALMAWSLAAEGHTDKALNLLAAAAAQPSTRRLYLLHAAMIAERLPTPLLAGQLYHRTGNASGDPLTLQILYAQLYSGWLERHGHHKEASDTVAALGVTSPLAALVIGPIQQNLPKLKSPTTALGGAVLNLQIALMVTDAIQQDGIPRDPAIIALQQAIFLDPGLTIARIFLADTFREANQITSGLTELDNIPASDPLAALAAQERINLALRSGDLEQEADALHRALVLRPDNPEFLIQLAEVEDQRGHHTQAVDLYTRALKASPPRKEILWPILLGRAMAAEESGNWPMVQDDMKHALELAPDQPEVLNFVGYANIEHNADQAQALAMLKKAVDLQPADASIQDSYAWALLKYRADLKTALPILVQAAEHSPSDAEIGYHLGVAYWYLGRHTEAQDQWNQSLDDSPQPQDRALLMQALQNGGPHLAAFEQKQ
ncbi:tetratricopeptide repeat protein [Gluconobacter sp. Dm-62]|uniref:tetratricopeptide repeat protein n=1 Tax=Gluconobacter sp. Dm-62 TaxID=2799804 RepID=UPI001B8C5EAB|nr:tetratricopeptide repeat protein [Gluconobacter sp. Dm-62]MBS1103817.1 tetratricopeptide repeat protein [Gluconobacter sp. Dm-62]